MPRYKLVSGWNEFQLQTDVMDAILSQESAPSIVGNILDALTLYDSAGAADYLGISINTLAYHLWQQKDIPRRLVPDLRVGQGRVFLFTKMTLDDWNASRRKAHRPRVG